MIGYILLITFAVVISVFVYQWLKTYVPKEGVECPDGVSIYISEATITNNILSLTLKNTGRFSIDGAIIYYSEDESQAIATKNLGSYYNGIGFTGIGISFGEPLISGDEKELKFNDAGSLNIKFIEITPTRIETLKNKKQTIGCGGAKVRKVISDEMSGCVDDDGDGFCLGEQENCVDIDNLCANGWNDCDDGDGSMWINC